MNLAPRERIYMADKTVCRWFDSTLPTNIINFKIMEQTFKDRIYNKLVNSILMILIVIRTQTQVLMVNFFHSWTKTSGENTK